MNTHKKIYCLIGARGGSKGIKNKNIIPLGGYELIAYSITASLQSKFITKTITNTDSMHIGLIARRYNAQVPFLRPKELASDTATDYEWILHTIDYLKNNNDLPDLIIHLRPTTPLREVDIIDNAISKFLQCPEATSLRSAHPLPESPYKMFIKDNEYFKPFMQMEKQEFYNLPRQSFPQVYAPNGYVDILRPEHILSNHNLHGSNILAYETKRVIEVDDVNSLEELQQHYKNNEIFKYLESIYNSTHERSYKVHK